MGGISGFLVVRKPEHAYGVNFAPNMRIGALTYRGIERLPWEDFSLSCFSGGLPNSLLPAWKELEQSGSELCGLKLLKRFGDAARVWEHWRDINEILAIRASLSDANAEVGLNYLGIDCFVLGEWSVLLDGPYARPEHFAEIIKRLNCNGLLASEKDSVELFDRYVELAKTEVVEPLASDARPTHMQIFSVAPAG